MITNPQNTKIKKTKSVPPVPFQNRGHLQSETESSESGESSDSTESIFAKFAQFAVSYSIFAKFAKFAVRYFTVFDNLRSIHGNLCKKAPRAAQLCIMH